MIAAMKQESIVFVMVLLFLALLNGRKAMVQSELFTTIIIGTSYQSR